MKPGVAEASEGPGAEEVKMVKVVATNGGEWGTELAASVRACLAEWGFFWEAVYHSITGPYKSISGRLLIDSPHPSHIYPPPETLPCPNGSATT